MYYRVELRHKTTKERVVKWCDSEQELEQLLILKPNYYDLVNVDKLEVI